MGKATRYGRRQQEEEWKNTEVDALYKLRDAGVRVPDPHGFFHGVLVMELVTDADGFAAPRLGEYEPTPAQAGDFHAVLVRKAGPRLCCGLIHGDLSASHHLWGGDGPVVIGFPTVCHTRGKHP